MFIYKKKAYVVAIIFIMVVVIYGLYSSSVKGKSFNSFGKKQIEENWKNYKTDEEITKVVPYKHNFSVSLLGEVLDKPLYHKEVFLTIDDGPSTENTLNVLKILNENNVKASFFEIGRNIEAHEDITKALVTSGMYIGNHSYSHDYKIYSDTKFCFQDFKKNDEIIQSATGKAKPKFLRFPGGSDNTASAVETMASIRKEAVNEGYYFVDWNVSSGDAAPGGLSTDMIIQNITTQCSDKSFAVVLMHDAPDKKTTVEALPRVIEYLKNNGFVFRTLEDATPTEINEMIKRGIINRGIK